MRSLLLKMTAGGLLLAGLATAPSLSIAQTPPAPAFSAPVASASMPAHDPKPADDFDSQKALADLRTAIAGKEKQPAETVFKNVQLFKGQPAGQLLGAMNGFTRALGVTCKKCHDVENFASDDKKNKKVARGMMTMSKDINLKYLQTMEGLDKDASVNCNTCHRGHAHPSDGMKPPASGSH